MKKIIAILLFSIFLTACTHKWEYKIITVDGNAITDFHQSTFDITNNDLNNLGKHGWELVDVYTIIETVHPNFGNSEYVTGIRENVRTRSINYVFKRVVKK